MLERKSQTESIVSRLRQVDRAAGGWAGTWGALGYTQHGNLPLMQLASVTGIWGIGFLIAWFAAVVNWAWNRQFDWGAIQSGILLYAAVWGLVMLAGGARLAFASEASTVRIAGIGWPQGIIEPSEFMRVIAPDFTATEREQVREKFVRVQDSFFERSRREVQAGAKIVVWPEANLMVAQVPVAAGLHTVYARIGDLFAWCCVVGLLASIAWRVFSA